MNRLGIGTLLPEAGVLLISYQTSIRSLSFLGHTTTPTVKER